MKTEAPNKRIQWVDAMRGLSMVAIVMSHVLGGLGLGGYDTPLCGVLLDFALPMFFFVSGFFTFRSRSWWTPAAAAALAKRRFQSLVVCTVVFAMLFQYKAHGELSLEYGFMNIWFTVALFQMFVIYFVLAWLSRLLGRDVSLWGMVVVSVALAAAGMLCKGQSWAAEYFYWPQLALYCQFFTLGILCSRFREVFYRSLNSNAVITVAILAIAAGLLLTYNKAFEQACPWLFAMVHSALRYAMIVVALTMFNASRACFTAPLGRPARWLVLIGRRTLDIYMIHMFFVPNLEWMRPHLFGGNMLVFQLAISACIAAVIIAICLLISQILRKSRTLAAWLFGARQTAAA